MLHETTLVFQGAFVRGRQILDVVLVANEIFEEYKEKTKEGLVLKVDLIRKGFAILSLVGESGCTFIFFC